MAICNKPNCDQVGKRRRLKRECSEEELLSAEKNACKKKIHVPEALLSPLSEVQLCLELL